MADQDNLWNFMRAAVDKESFRAVLNNGNEQAIRTALRNHNVNLDSAHEGPFIQVCIANQREAHWPIFERMRVLLLGNGGGSN